jgi:acetyl-CoA C-acetyltransferase
MKFSKNIYLCQALRTPIGSFQGALASQPAPDLAAQLIKALLQRTGIADTHIDEVILGCVLTAGIGQAPARQALIRSGLANSTQALTVNKVCSSGLKAVLLAAQQIELGISHAIIAGGMENMSQAPYLLPALRAGARLGNVEAVDSIIRDGLWDPYNNYHMGDAGELCAREHKISRQQQDDYAEQSYRRAQAAQAEGAFKDEILPIAVTRGKAESSVEIDEEPGKVNFEKLKSLRPAFQKDGSITAANASKINDGAALMLVCSEEYLQRHALKPLAKVHALGVAAQAPEWFTTAPVKALEAALQSANLRLEQIDLFEINEAFAVVALACAQALKLPHERLNVHGGAVALGHPIGASGARILCTLVHALKRRALRYGAAAICNGGGEATALVVEAV